MIDHTCPICELVYDGTHCEVCDYTHLTVWELDEIRESERGEHRQEIENDDKAIR